MQSLWPVPLFALVWLSWDSSLMLPVKLLVVFFHELSHAMAAWMTGGAVVRIEVAPQQGGLCVTEGGSRFWTLTAGYLGSLLWGGAIFVAASRTGWDRWLQILLGLLLVVSALLWVRPLVGFGFGFTMAAGLSLGLLGVLLPATVSDLLLRFIGLTSILYAVFDIRSDVLSRPHLQQSDAARLAELTGVPTLVWGGLWMLLALAAGFGFLIWAARSQRPRLKSEKKGFPGIQE